MHANGLRGSVRLAGRREADCPADPIETSESLAPTSLSFLSIAESAWLLLWHLGASVKAADLSPALQNSCSLALSPGTGCKYLQSLTMLSRPRYQGLLHSLFHMVYYLLPERRLSFHLALAAWAGRCVYCVSLS